MKDIEQGEDVPFVERRQNFVDSWDGQLAHGAEMSVRLTRHVMIRQGGVIASRCRRSPLFFKAHGRGHNSTMLCKANTVRQFPLLSLCRLVCLVSLTPKSADVTEHLGELEGICLRDDFPGVSLLLELQGQSGVRHRDVWVHLHLVGHDGREVRTTGCFGRSTQTTTTPTATIHEEINHLNHRSVRRVCMV